MFPTSAGTLISRMDCAVNSDDKNLRWKPRYKRVSGRRKTSEDRLVNGEMRADYLRRLTFIYGKTSRRLERLIRRLAVGKRQRAREQSELIVDIRRISVRTSGASCLRR